jgi:hypothetical protein
MADDRKRSNPNPWDDPLKRQPAEVPAPRGSLAGGEVPAEHDDRRSGTTGAFSPPESTDRDRAARARMAGAFGGPGADRSQTGGKLPTMVSGFQREGSQRGATTGVPEEALPLADKGQGRD